MTLAAIPSLVAGLIWGLIAGAVIVCINHRRTTKQNILSSGFHISLFSLCSILVFFAWVFPAGFQGYLTSAIFVSSSFGIGTFMTTGATVSIWNPKKNKGCSYQNSTWENVNE